MYLRAIGANGLGAEILNPSGKVQKVATANLLPCKGDPPTPIEMEVGERPEVPAGWEVSNTPWMWADSGDDWSIYDEDEEWG